MSTSEESREPAAGAHREASVSRPGPSAPPRSCAVDGPAADLRGMTPMSPVGRLAATVDRLSREVRAAQAEAEGRALIELAKGILVARLGCGPAQAARQLAELAEQSQVTPLEFAVDVINQAARDRVSEVTDAFLAATAAVRNADTVEGPDGPDGGEAGAGSYLVRPYAEAAVRGLRLRR
ncbi:ANTAR domain-containing protein, partial [Streptomyces geysiriensis]|uniref:ANTAR domain-containing protein n=1 Tax=Streptomyces geysiriensis TaxID=68207 RepID=UPI001C7DF338|nr:ANTAR domain-containing protein [Streptomyces geysiriensis]